MSKKIKRLTPALLKRIIAEERERLVKESSANKKKSIKSKAKEIKKDIKVLNETKQLQKDLVLKFKKLYQIRRLVKKNLIKRL
jgi:hypothetical protein